MERACTATKNQEDEQQTCSVLICIVSVVPWCLRHVSVCVCVCVYRVRFRSTHDMCCVNRTTPHSLPRYLLENDNNFACGTAVCGIGNICVAQIKSVYNAAYNVSRSARQTCDAYNV